ncbi:MAG: hypothetical protein HY296_02240 [Thaumarchaeota archaeon]|nr:hypothetical protein [Nitrososphaerota archaeon]
MSLSPRGELVFVVDVTSFTEKGFVGSTSYGGMRVDLEFDDGDDGVYLTAEMAKRIGAKKGTAISVVVEDDRPQIANAKLTSVGRKLRVSDPKVYYAVGREGGAVIRIRKT